MPQASLVRVAAILLVALPAAFAIACGDGLAPEGIAGTYILQQVEADHLPAIILTTEFVRVRVLADTLRLRADDTGAQISIWEIEPLQAGLEFDNPTRVQTDLRLVMKGGHFEGTIVCPPYATCTRPPQWVARLVTEGLRVDFAAGQRVPLLYTRATGVE